MNTEQPETDDRIYHPPECIGGRWYHLFETTGGNGNESVRAYGPFESREAAYTHQQRRMLENGDAATSGRSVSASS